VPSLKVGEVCRKSDDRSSFTLNADYSRLPPPAGGPTTRDEGPSPETGFFPSKRRRPGRTDIVGLLFQIPREKPPGPQRDGGVVKWQPLPAPCV